MRHWQASLLIALVAVSSAVKFLDYAQLQESEDLVPLQDEFGNELFVVSENVQQGKHALGCTQQDDTLDTLYQKDTELFSIDQLNQSIQDFNLIQQIPDIQLENESENEQKDEFLGLERDLEASGDCIILYSECSYKGYSKQTCSNPEEALSFELPIKSIYVPDGQMITIYDQKELVSHAFMQSMECLKTSISLSFIPSDVIFSHNAGNAFQITENSKNQNSDSSSDETVQYQSVTAKIPTENVQQDQNQTPGSVAKLNHESDQPKQADVIPQQSEPENVQAQSEEQNNEAPAQDTNTQEAPAEASSAEQSDNEPATQEEPQTEIPAEEQKQEPQPQNVDTLAETQNNNSEGEIQW